MGTSVDYEPFDSFNRFSDRIWGWEYLGYCTFGIVYFAVTRKSSVLQ